MKKSNMKIEKVKKAEADAIIEQQDIDMGVNNEDARPINIPEPDPMKPNTNVDSTQQIQTEAYVPTYKISPEFKPALLKAIGDLPFNQIAGLINAIEVKTIDHQTLTQIVNAIGQFPYTRVEFLLKNISSFVTQVIE